MKKYISLCIIFVTIVVTVVNSSSDIDDSRIALEEAQTRHSHSSKVSSSDVYPNESSYEEDIFSNHAFISCDTWELEPDEFILYENKTLYVEAYNKTYDSSAYLLRGDVAVVCVPEAPIEVFSDKFSKATVHLARICLGISIICLSLHLIAFILVAELRNMPGCNTAALCASLLFGYVFHLTGYTDLRNYEVYCVTLAALSYFFLLSAFLWMSVIAFDVFNSLLTATGKLRLKTTEFKMKKFSLCCAYSWGLPMVLVACALVLDNVAGIPDDYRPTFAEICWFGKKMPLLILFATPVFAVTVANAVFFGLSACTIYRNRMKTENHEQRNIQKYFAIYLRLAIIMGITWIFGVLSSAVNEPAMYYISSGLNALQGLFIFLAFTCSAKVLNYIREKLHLQIRRPSTVTLPTFQSYYNNGYSVDKSDNIS